MNLVYCAELGMIGIAVAGVTACRGRVDITTPPL